MLMILQACAVFPLGGGWRRLHSRGAGVLSQHVCAEHQGIAYQKRYAIRYIVSVKCPALSLFRLHFALGNV